MNDPQQTPTPRCLSPETCRRLVERSLSESEEAGVVAHLDECLVCRKKIEDYAGHVQDLEAFRRVHRQTSTAAVEKMRSECAAAIPSWEDRGGFVELVPGLRLAPPRDKRFVARLGKFDIAGMLGRGGMGYVLDAYDPQLRRPVAVKVMKPELNSDQRAAARFLQEARVAARLQHPNVVTVHDAGTETDPWFIVMEYIRGKSLSSLIDCEARLQPVRAARITLEVLAGLANAHESGVIHRDVKPSNVLLDARTEAAKLADFGLARSVEEALRHTAEGHVPGTPWYMAPEQAMGNHELDGRCDLFSTGIMLFEMLTGVLPFPGRASQEVLHRICHDATPDPRELAPQVPNAFVHTIQMALQKDPDSRYPSAIAFASDLQDYLTERQEAAMAPTELWRRHATQQDPKLVAALLERRQARPPFHASLWIQRCASAVTRDILTIARDSTDCCRIGEKITLQVRADVDCYVTLIDVGAGGNVFVLLLNHAIRGGTAATLDGPDDRHEWIVGGPAGIERIKAIFTRQPLALSGVEAFSPLARSGLTRDILLRMKQVDATLDTMAADTWTDAICQFLVESG